MRRFGEVVARPGPGLWVGLPWGIDRVDRVQVRTVRQLDVGFLPDAAADLPATPPGQLLTGDQNLVNVKLVVEYAIEDRDGELEAFVVGRVFAVRQQHLIRLVQRDEREKLARAVGNRFPSACEAGFLNKRRARDSNPQPLAGQLISNQSASHSLTLRSQM